MKQNAIQRFRDIWIYFFQVGQPVIKDNVAVLRLEHAEGRMLLLKKIRHEKIPLAGQVDQYIADAEKIIAVNVFTVAIVEIEIDPAVVAALPVDNDMITPDVPVFLTLAVKVADGLDAGLEAVKNSRKIIKKITLMAAGQFLDSVVE